MFSKVSATNFRCFRECKNIPLAPITLLVGENSTGKSSFLAMLRMMGKAFVEGGQPDFNEEPYELGAFDEIVTGRGGTGKKADHFTFGGTVLLPQKTTDIDMGAEDSIHSVKFNRSREINFETNFCRGMAGGVIVTGREFSIEEINFSQKINKKSRLGSDVNFSKKNDFSKIMNKAINFINQNNSADEILSVSMKSLLMHDLVRNAGESLPNIEMFDRLFSHFDIIYSDFFPREEGEIISIQIGKFQEFQELVAKIIYHLDIVRGFSLSSFFYASAPIRSKPKRTYDPRRTTSDPEGEYIPSLLAGICRSQPEEWKKLKANIESFGKQSGLFSEIDINNFGKKSGSGPFQLVVRSGKGKDKSPWRNLVDIGYGVSQILPLLVEIYREKEAKIFLLQQPEVHLHPSAQATLGTFFSDFVKDDKKIRKDKRRQFVIETHSDYLVDRIRLEIRKKTIKPEDVSLLFFERKEMDTKIHQIPLGEKGSPLEAPQGYRIFFLKEQRSLLGIEDT